MIDEEAVELLNALGETSAAVATRLAELGVKGQRDHTGQCPIACYLREAGAINPTVVPDGVDFEDEDGDCHVVSLRDTAIADFIREFDSGVYPALVEEEQP